MRELSDFTLNGSVATDRKFIAMTAFASMRSSSFPVRDTGSQKVITPGVMTEQLMLRRPFVFS
jgi:PleD family two-component response regulator